MPVASAKHRHRFHSFRIRCRQNHYHCRFPTLDEVSSDADDGHGHDDAGNDVVVEPKVSSASVLWVVSAVACRMLRNFPTLVAEPAHYSSESDSAVPLLTHPASVVASSSVVVAAAAVAVDTATAAAET